MTSQAFKAIKDTPFKYHSHTTRVCRYQDLVLAVTKFQMKFTRRYEQIELQFTKTLKSRVLECPNKLECVVVAPGQLKGYTGEGFGPLACFVAQFEGQKYYMEGVGSTLSETLVCPYETQRRAEIIGYGYSREGHVHLKTSLCPPNWLNQDTSTPTVYPDMKVEEALTLEVTCSPKTEIDSFCSLAILSVTVELLELTCVNQKGFKSTKTLRFQKLSYKNYFQCLKSPCKFALPREVYESSIPDVGPTFYSSTETRNYAIKVRVGLIDLERVVPLMVERLVDINVARMDEKTLRSLILKKQAKGSLPSGPTYNRLFIEAHRPSKFIPDGPKASFDVLDQCETLPELQKTLLVHGFNKVITITNIQSKNSEIKTLGPSKDFWTSEKASLDLYCSMEYRLFKVQKANTQYLWIGPTITNNGMFFTKNLPLDLWDILNRELRHLDYAEGPMVVFFQTSTRKTTKPMYLRPITTPKLHPNLKGQGVVVANGMKVSEFLTVRIVCPFSWEVTPDTSIDLKLDLVVARIKEEADPEKEEFCFVLASKEVFHWDDFTLSETGNEWYMDVSPKWLNGDLKGILPTFHTNNVFKRTTLDVSFTFRSMGSSQTCLVQVPLAVCLDCVDVTGYEVIPPEYAVLADPEEVERFGEFRDMLEVEDICGVGLAELSDEEWPEVE